MKKSVSFFFCFIILLAAGGFAFYTGWSQFKVEPGSVGFLVSKTGGINTEPITHDKFSWNWEFLLPTNATLMVFTPKPCTFDKKIKGILPSGKEYAAVYNGAADFSYWFDFAITLKCTDEQIAQLIKEKEVSSQEDLDKYLDRIADAISAAAANDVVSAVEKGSIENISLAEGVILESAQKNCKNATVDSIALSSYSFPDISLYQNAKNSYAEYILKVELAAAEAAKQAAEEKTKFGATLQKMESLGEMLEKYPALSEMLKNSDSVTQFLDKIDSF